MTKKTYTSKEKIKPKWYLIDAKDQNLGRLASKIAQIIRGKHKTIFSPHLDLGDYVVVINAKRIKVTGGKEKKKIYYRHSGYPGGLKKESLEDLLGKNPTKVIEKAVWGMIPHNKLGRQVIKKLKIFPEENHSYQSQELEKI